MAKNKVHPSDNNFQSKPKNNNFFQRKTNKNHKSKDNSPNKSDHKKPFEPNKFPRGKVDKRKNKVSDLKNSTDSKKPFDKKQWRLRTYSQKYQVNQWEEKRKKAVLKQYYRELKDDTSSKQGFDVKKIYEQEADSDDERKTNHKNNFVTHPDFRNKLNDVIDNTVKPSNQEEDSPRKFKKMSAFKAAHLEYERIKDKKREKKEEYLRQKAEREEALKKYKKNKTEKYKKLSKKTRKGQPVMKDRIEMLLEQIEAST